MPRTSYALKTFGSSIPGDPSGRGGSFVPTLPSENRAARTGRRDHSAIALPRTMCRMERKLATVLFVDLVDSTERLAGRDPEVVRRQVTSFFDEVARCIVTHGGTVEKFAGDAVMAAFGIPLAHEDDAERALRAALEIVPKVEELGLSVRVGVESGEVVVEDSDSTFATGEAVNLAARLQQAAEPGQLLLGPGAHRLTLGRVEVEGLGPIEMKGLAAPVWTWRALGTDGSGGARA